MAGEDQATPAFRESTDRRARRAAAALAAAVMAAFVAMYLPQPLLPDLSKTLDIAPATSAAVISALTIGIALASPFLAPLSDLFGRRPLLLVATFGLAPTGFATSIIADVSILLVLRAIQGAFVAIILSTGLAYLGEEFSASVTARLTGIFIAATVMGGVVSRLAGGAIGELYGWRAAFAFTGLAALLAGVILWRLLPPSRRFTRASHLGKAFQDGLAHWRNPRLRVLYFVGFAIFFSSLGLFNALPFRLSAEPYGLAPSWIGLTYLVFLAGVVSANIVGPLLRRMSSTRVLAFALVGTAIAHLTTVAQPLPLLVLTLLFLTFMHFLTQSTASALVTLIAREARAGANAHYLLSYYVGGSIGSLASVAMLPSWGWTSVVLVNAALLTAVLLAVLRVGRQERGEGDENGKPAPVAHAPH